MKPLMIILTMLLLPLIGAAESTVASGESNTFLNNYKIVQTANNLFELSYANTSEKFSIEVCPEAEQCCYLVRGDKLEVMYLCNPLGFGLRKMPDKLQKLPTSEYCKFLNYKTFMHHSRISPLQPDRDKALGLIACFFPEVIVEDARAQVFLQPKNTRENKLAAIDR